MKFLTTLAVAIILLPGSGFAAASKEMQELQRDVAQLQEQVRSLQSTVDKQNGSMMTMVQQLVEANNKTNSVMTLLTGSVSEKLNQQLQTGLKPVAGVSTDLRNVGNDTTALRGQVSDLTVAMNKILQQLNDINNQMKVMQTPAAPPPSAVNNGGPATSASAVPPVPASTLWTNARRDYSGGKMDLSMNGFQDFLKFYPNDPMAPQAQFYIGQIHYSGNQLDQAAQDFDAVLERYPDNDITAEAQVMKGRSLVRSGKREAGIKEFKSVIAKYPGTDSAKTAASQLKALGVPTASAAPAKKPVRRR